MWLRPWRVVLLLAAVGTVRGSSVAPAAEPATRPEPPVVLQVLLTIPADEYTAMQHRARSGFPGFGPAPKAPQKSADPDREVHRNTFGTELPWAAGDITIGNDTFKNVGVRYKGNGTLMDSGKSAKKSFRIDLDRTGGTARFHGSKTINLHSGVADPSKYREALGYGIYRAAGVPAPTTRFAEVRLTVPGKHADELLGLYTVTEEVDKPFLRDRFGSDKGLLMKPEGLRDFEDRGARWDRYEKQYRPKRAMTPDEADRVIAFAKLVHKADDAAFREGIGSYLDIEAYLRFLAATAFVANGDSLFGLGHNYYLYLHPTTGKLHFIPWDLDRAFANIPVLGSNEQKLDLSIVHPYAGAHRLTDRILAMPGVGEKYQALFKELAATCFARGRLLAELDAAEAALREPLARDEKAAEDRKDGDIAGRLQGMYGRTPTLRDFVEKRTASVAAQLAGNTKGFVPTSAFGMGPPKMTDMMAGPLMDGMDADGNGKLSREEWIGAAKRAFAACEADSNGRVDAKALATGLNSLFPKPPEGAPPPPLEFTFGHMMAGPIVARADADKDGRLTTGELTQAAGAAFDESDKKKAGSLDRLTFADLLGVLFPAPRFGPQNVAPPRPQ